MVKYAEERKFTWPQIRYWIAAWGLFFGGLVATIWGDEFPWGKMMPAIKELGPGIFTAGILALLIEPFFRREFARDAFLAAFRYILPAELKDEVEKILAYNFICD